MKRIVVDSSASLYQLDGVDFAAVPLKIVTDEREYLDDDTGRVFCIGRCRRSVF